MDTSFSLFCVTSPRSWIRRVSILWALTALPLAACSGPGEGDVSQSSDENDEKSSDKGDEENSSDSMPKPDEQDSSSDKNDENKSKDSDKSDKSESGDESESGEESKDDDSDSSEDKDKDSDSDDSGEGDSSSDEKDKEEKRDCEKIAWGGGTLAKGQIVPETKVNGYVDEDGDGRLETQAMPAGMCELHLSGKRCGLIVYGAARKEGKS